MANEIKFVVLGDVKNFEKNIGRLGDKFQTLGKRMTLGITLPVGLAIGKFVSLASAAEETRNKFKQVMGDMTDQADEFTKRVSKGIGRNITDLEDGLASFQAFAKGMGFTSEEAFALSTKLQELSLDFASFNNMSDTEALQRFISAMSGSGEVLDRFGINIKQSNLDLKLQALGLADSTSAATENQKAMARLAIIEESLSAQGAVGDALRTQNSFANVMKRMRSVAKTLGEELGKKLIPIATDLTRSATKLLVSFNKLGDATQRNFLIFISLLAIVGPLAFVIGSLAKAYLAAAAAVAVLNTQLVFLSSVQMLGLNTSVLVLIKNVGFLYPALLIIGTAAAAAFVGWKLGELIRDLPVVSKFLDDIGAKLGELRAQRTLDAGYISEEDFNLQRELEGWQARADARAKDLEDQQIVHEEETILKDEKLIREEEFLAKLRELSLIDLSAMQQDMQLQVNLLESFEKKKTEIIKQEIQRRKALADADKNIQLASLNFVSQMVQAFGKESKAAFYILKAVRVGEILVNSAAAAMSISAVWAWNPPVEAALLTKNNILTALSLATVVGTTIAGFESGAANIPRDQIAQVHAGEMVVTEPIAESIRSGDLSLSGGGGGGGIVFDFSNTTFNGVTESFVQDIFTKASESINNRTLSPLPAV